jgi:biotin synthase
MDWDGISDQVLDGQAIERETAQAVLESGNEELQPLLQAAFRVREHYWGRGVRVHVLRNAKSGICSENCSFCSQSAGAYSGIDHYMTQSVEELVGGAHEAHQSNATKYCIVTATRGPSDAQLDVICEAVRQIKQEIPIDICTSLGLLNERQAGRLAEAGVDRYNHNLETSEAHYGKICQTHTFGDRLDTLRNVKEAGMEMCCGGIMGMGEDRADRVALAFTVRDLKVESIPVNFLDPRPGTALEDLEIISPEEALRCLCMFRFVNPEAEIRIAGGREVCLKHMQAHALYPANSLFSEGYLTTPGQGAEADRLMIEEAGFEIENPCSKGSGTRNPELETNSK